MVYDWWMFLHVHKQIIERFRTSAWSIPALRKRGGGLRNTCHVRGCLFQQQSAPRIFTVCPQKRHPSFILLARADIFHHQHASGVFEIHSFHPRATMPGFNIEVTYPPLRAPEWTRDVKQAVNPRNKGCSLFWQLEYPKMNFPIFTLQLLCAFYLYHWPSQCTHEGVPTLWWIMGALLPF